MELATIFPSKYIKAADLKGREPTVVIAKAEIEKLGEDNKLVLYFQGKEKGLVTNRTNADRIAYLYGTNTDGWVGKEIVLYTDMVNFQGKVTEAIRVKPPAPRPPANGGPRENKVPQPNIPGRIPAHEVEDKGRYDTMRRTEPVKTTGDDLPSEEIPF